MNEVRTENENKKITFLVVAILVLMITISGGTYAYLALSVVANNNITGSVASVGLQFSPAPNLVSPTGDYINTPLVPQYAYNNSKNVLQLAVSGVTPKGKSSVFPCVDAEGNAVCRVYTFTIQNKSTAAVNVSGTIKFTNPSTNLKWAPMSNATTVAAISSSSDSDIHAATNGEVALTDAESTPNSSWYLNAGSATSTCTSAAGSCKQFWIVVWVNETGVVQSDTGTWYATISFKDSNGKGVTSSIKGDN